MSIKVGIPRALLYYYYYPQWITFFNHLGVETVVSGKTTRGILDKGLKSTVDEACLPVKLAVGHVIDLRDKVDYIFLPRIISTARREYICPKFLGFPDMVRHTIEGLPPLIDFNYNMYGKGSNPRDFFFSIGKLFTRNPVRIMSAYQASKRALEQYRTNMIAGMKQKDIDTCPHREPGAITIAVIGHPYNIYDRHISMNMIERLEKNGAKVLTADHLADSVVRSEAEKLPKKLFWTINQRMIGAAYHYFKKEDVHGIIHVASFGCGPDSITGELIEIYARSGSRKPLLNLTIDEHTGEAGLITRLEAFLDMVRWRRNLVDVEATL